MVRSRPLENMIANLICKHAMGEVDEAVGPPAAKRFKFSAAYMEEGCRKSAVCSWRGHVGDLAAHLGKCELALVECHNTCCKESLLRRDFAQHEAACAHRTTICGDCKIEMCSRSLAEHEGRCTKAKIQCLTAGCSVVFERAAMPAHRAECEYEEVACPCPACDASVLRKDVDVHVEATHLAVQQLRAAWGEAERWKSIAVRLHETDDTLQSELRHAAPSPTSWVFNWRADGWESAVIESDFHEFGDGGVSGNCMFEVSITDGHSHFIGFGFTGRATCRVQTTFFVLDRNDKTLREWGGGTAPREQHGREGSYAGIGFTPTAEEKGQSVRADGSIRLRAVVRLFMDDAA